MTELMSSTQKQKFESPSFGCPIKITLPILALRPREAAAALGISETALKEYTPKENIPHFHLGTIVLYPIVALQRWLLKKSQQEQGETHE